MEHELNLEQLFDQAVQHFPYPNLEPTSITQGTLEESDTWARVKYAEEFSVEVGQLLGEPLLAGGWIELLKDTDGDIQITGFFGIARNGDWKNGSILPKETALHGVYALDTQTWKLWIGSY